MNVMSISDFKLLRESSKPFQLIDIREFHETQVCSLGGEHIPMGELMESLDLLRKDVPVIFHCKTGRRSLAVIETLLVKTDLKNIYSLEGGIIAWAKQVDSTMSTY